MLSSRLWSGCQADLASVPLLWGQAYWGQFLSRGQVSVSSSVSFPPKMSLPYTADWTLGVLVKYSFIKLNRHLIFYLLYLEDDLILSLYTEIERNGSFLPTGKFECTHWRHPVWFSTSISSCVSSLDRDEDSSCPLPGWGDSNAGDRMWDLHGRLG